MMNVYGRPEISDLIIQHEYSSTKRIPVLRKDALAKCGSFYARSVIRKIPHTDGVLCADSVDRVLVQSHGELQRLWEEFYHAQRVSKVLHAIVASLRAVGIQHKLRLIDVGCGSGYVLRWLAAHDILKDDIDLVGVDFNKALILQAQRLAEIEELEVDFQVANAFQLAQQTDIFISSGVLHHIGKEDLGDFFQKQLACKPLAFAHFDPQSCWATPIGSFLFHFARMRTPLARYDGWLSAARAHPGKVLENAVRSASSEWSFFRYHPPIPWFPLVRTLTGILAIVSSAEDVFQEALDEPMYRINQ